MSMGPALIIGVRVADASALQAELAAEWDATPVLCMRCNQEMYVTKASFELATAHDVSGLRYLCGTCLKAGNR